jgi:hypothetical protein
MNRLGCGFPAKEVLYSLSGANYHFAFILNEELID